MRILVTGSRDWPSEEIVQRTLMGIWLDNDKPNPDKMTLVSGHCLTGADKFAEDCAQTQGWKIELHPADWSKGRSAGPVRNKEMVNLGADICVAFIYNKSKGASGTLELAKKAHMPIDLWSLDHARSR